MRARPPMVHGSSSDAVRRARIKSCSSLADTLARLTRDLDRIEDTKGVGAAYYTKLDQCTRARNELADALREFLRDQDREGLQALREAARSEAARLRAIDQALGDAIAQWVDAEQVRHELFAVPVMLPRAFANTALSGAIRGALAQAWLRLNDGRDHDEDEVRITVLSRLFEPARIERLDEISAYAWLLRRAQQSAQQADDDDDDDEGQGGGSDAAAADDGPGDDEIGDPIAGISGDADPQIEHWDETSMALRYVVMHVATPPEWLDDDEAMAADDLRPYLPNFADLPKNHLDWSADARRAMARITRGPINVGFPDDIRAARVSGRYFAQFWIGSYELHRQLKANDAEDDAAQIACSLHRNGLDERGKPRLSVRLSVLDDDGDLLAGHVITLDDVFTLEVVEPIAADLALALSIDEQIAVPGLHELPDERPGKPLFHTLSGWKTLT